jgi:hypothetical protein
MYFRGTEVVDFSAGTKWKEVLAFAHMELGDTEPAWNHFKKVLEMEAQGGFTQIG